MKQKHFVDIERIQFGNELQASNIDLFAPGDHIQISEKIDGSNASVRFDAETNSLRSFSRKHELSPDMQLDGFYAYTKTLDPKQFCAHSNYAVFGEWLTKHTVKYDPDMHDRWYVYDIYDINTDRYLEQTEVQAFCESSGLTYVHVLYDGPFTDWDNVIAFASAPSLYGAETMEGIVVKDQDKLHMEYDPKHPFVLKYVNAEFAETKHSNHVRKSRDPQHTQERAEAEELVASIVTERRVEKEIQKMQDEELLPKNVSPRDMKIIASLLPKRIEDDCIKEEPDIVKAAGDYFYASCQRLTMNFARNLILG